MPTTTLRPNGDVVNNNVATTGGTTSAVLADNNDATYVRATVIVGSARVAFDDWAQPANTVVVSVTPRVRAAPDAGGTTAIAIEMLFDGTPQGQQTLSGIAALGTVSFPAWNGAYTNSTINSLMMDLLLGPDIGGPYHGWRAHEAYLDVLYANPPSAPTVFAPSGTITSTARPTIQWIYNPGTDGGGQIYYRVRIFESAVYSAGGFNASTSTAAWDSGDVNSAALGAAPTVDLVNGKTYKAYVYTIAVTNGVLQYSTWGAGPTFTLAIPIAVPTAVSPVGGATVSSSRPSLDATVAATVGNPQVFRRWQLSQSSTFASGIVQVDEPSRGATRAGAVSFVSTSGATRLAQGSWYVRCATVDPAANLASAWSSTNNFTVAHPPTTGSRSPSAGNSAPYGSSVTLSWTFSSLDPEDTQVKYQAQLWKVTDAVGSLKDSGVVTSTNLFHVFSGLDSSWKDVELRWKVNVYDVDNVASGYSADTSFYLRDVPTITVTSPTNAQVITTPAPLFTWTFAATSGRTQTQWKIDITNLDAATLVGSSGWVVGTATSFQVTSPIIAVGPHYQAVLTVIDSVGLQSSTTRNFTASYAAPTTPTWSLDVSRYADLGRVSLDWSGTTAMSGFVAWRVYRRQVGTVTWTLLSEYTDPLARSLVDYLAPSQVDNEWTVVQVATSFGVAVESAYVSKHYLGTMDKYVLVCPSQPSLNLVLYEVSADNFSSEQEMAKVNLPGRGRRVEYGTRYGQEGSLTAMFRNRSGGLTARQQRLALEGLRDSQLTVYLRNPFGDVWRVALATAAITRVGGVGLHEMASAQIDYSEITAVAAPITSTTQSTPVGGGGGGGTTPDLSNAIVTDDGTPIITDDGQYIIWS